MERPTSEANTTATRLAWPRWGNEGSLQAPRLQ